MMTVHTLIDLVAQSQEPAQLNPFWILLGQGAFLTGIVTVFTLLHKSAINAYKEMVQQNKEIAANERQRADIANAQLMELRIPIKRAQVGEQQ
jgi:hypothetical protein